MLGRGNKVLSVQVDNLGENVGIMYGSRSVYDMKDKVKWDWGLRGRNLQDGVKSLK